MQRQPQALPSASGHPQLRPQKSPQKQEAWVRNDIEGCDRRARRGWLRPPTRAATAVLWTISLWRAGAGPTAVLGILHGTGLLDSDLCIRSFAQGHLQLVVVADGNHQASDSQAGDFPARGFTLGLEVAQRPTLLSFFCPLLTPGRPCVRACSRPCGERRVRMPTRHLSSMSPFCAQLMGLGVLLFRSSQSPQVPWSPAIGSSSNTVTFMAMVDTESPVSYCRSSN